MRIGLFGGSFNPIHSAHIKLVNWAFEKLKLDEVIFIPCYKSTDKSLSSYAPIYHRINMLILALPKNSSISTYEISQRRAVQTIETLRHFRNAYPKEELFFLMGEDNLDTIETWQDYKDMDKLVRLVIFRRYPKKLKLNTKGLSARVVNNELWDESSTFIRENQESSYLDNLVEIYIRDNGLYGFAG